MRRIVDCIYRLVGRQPDAASLGQEVREMLQHPSAHTSLLDRRTPDKVYYGTALLLAEVWLCAQSHSSVLTA
jgi:hypothetical protein